MAIVEVEYEKKKYKKEVIVSEEKTDKYVGKVGTAFFIWDVAKFDYPLVKVKRGKKVSEKDLEIARLLIEKQIEELEKQPKVSYTFQEKIMLDMINSGSQVTDAAKKHQRKLRTKAGKKWKQQEVGKLKFAGISFLIQMAALFGLPLLVFLYLVMTTL